MSTRIGATFKGKFTDSQCDTYIMELMDSMDRVEICLNGAPKNATPQGTRNNGNPGTSNNNGGNNGHGGNDHYAEHIPHMEQFVNGKELVGSLCRAYLKKLIMMNIRDDGMTSTKKVCIDFSQFLWAHGCGSFRQLDYCT